jgi:pimeloyl-ACP methyl ester carboxylesterase
MTTKKSTNVRTLTAMPVSKLAIALRAVEWFSPRAAGEVLRKLFFRAPKRRKVMPQEQAILNRAQRSQAATGGESVAVYSWGSAGPRVILVHGWGGNAAQMTPLVEPLLEAGYAVTAFDAPAHGASSGTSMTIPMLAQAVRDVGGANVHLLVAHSMGAASAMLAVTRGFEVERAVFISPPSDPAMWFQRFSEYFQLSPAMRLQTRLALEAHVAMSMEELRATSLGASFNAPLLVIHDRNDREVSHADGETVVKSVPEGRMISTEGLGHRKILSERTVIESTVGFLAGETRNAGCKTCGAQKEGGLEVCARCQLAEDLYDRSRRWSLLSAA